MFKNFILIFLLISLYMSCKKEDKTIAYSYQYKLAGIYQRDTSLKSDGYKTLDLRSDGNYCWTRVINGKDSIFCYGKYIQTSDSTLLWEDAQQVQFKITNLDTIFKGAIQLQIFGSPIVPPLYNIY
ncbi:MAG: hypothetical protein SGJ00_15245 [bacterium]|nr:hypothetical protein [bacterium]